MKQRKGFTLAELLIVITVIGVLASMMMVSSNETVSTSRAMDIVANLRSLKGAALMHYIDSIDYYSTTEAQPDDFTIEKIRKYVDRETGEDADKLGRNEGYFAFEGREGSNLQGRWYVGYIFNKNDADIIPKLAARAKTLTLLAANGAGGDESAGTLTEEALFTIDAGAIAMKVR